VLKGSVSELRRVLEDDAREPTIIQTIPKRGGYRLLAPVTLVNGAIPDLSNRAWHAVPIPFLAVSLLARHGYALAACSSNAENVVPREPSPLRTFSYPEKRIGSVLHICEHWDVTSAMQKGKQPWDNIGQLCRLLAEMSAGCRVTI
jgi:hypothetical protein